MNERRVTRPEKDEVSRRAGGRCEYCRSPAYYTPAPFSVEHIQPQATGGVTPLDNLALSCQGCNNFKYTATRAIDPATGTETPLYDPRQDQWAEHFAWSDDFLRIIGLTPTGRATVARLKLNRATVVNLRGLLLGVGEHPPPTG